MDLFNQIDENFLREMLKSFQPRRPLTYLHPTNFRFFKKLFQRVKTPNFFFSILREQSADDVKRYYTKLLNSIEYHVDMVVFKEIITLKVVRKQSQDPNNRFETIMDFEFDKQWIIHILYTSLTPHPSVLFLLAQPPDVLLKNSKRHGIFPTTEEEKDDRFNIFSVFQQNED